MRRFARNAAILLLALGTDGACGADDVGPRSRMVGGRCTTASDCVERCVTGAAFPGGYCTVTCVIDADCPGGSTCVATSGGVCLATCRLPADCEAFGPEYRCESRTNQSGGAGARACAAL